MTNLKNLKSWYIHNSEDYRRYWPFCRITLHGSSAFFFFLLDQSKKNFIEIVKKGEKGKGLGATLLRMDKDPKVQ